jgi:DNA repair exonuclease SbcCD ATPase subunit
MKRLLLFLLATSFVPSLSAAVTSHSLFSRELAAAAEEKVKEGGRFRDDSHQATLAAIWDLLPDTTNAQKDAKQRGRLNFYKVFNVYPDQVDLSKMTQYVSLAQFSKQADDQYKQAEQKYKGQITNLEKSLANLDREHQKTTGESSALSGALNNYSNSLKNLFKALESSEEAYTNEAGDLESHHLAMLKTNLTSAQDAYNEAKDFLAKKARDFNIDVDLTNSYLNVVVKGELAKFGEIETPKEGQERQQQPETEKKETGRRLPE